MKWFVKAITLHPDGGEYHPCGTDYSTLYNDLKTVKGVYNRVKDRIWRKNVIRVDIYKYYNIYDKDTYTKVYSFIPNKFMTF